jgi:hypothetical protein
MTALDVRSPATRAEVGEWPDLNDPRRRAELTPAALKAMRRLADSWHLSVKQAGDLLGGVPSSTWHAWKASLPPELGVDQLTRVSLLLGIYTSLHVLHPGELADSWVSRPNTNVIFGSRTPLQAMIDGGIPALVQVRSLLDGRRGGL